MGFCGKKDSFAILRASLLCLFIALMLCASFAAQDSPAQDAAVIANEPATTESPSVPDPALRLGAGDLIQVGVYNVPELSTKTRISNSGDVYLPLIDYVHVGALSVEEAQAVIEKRLSEGGFVKDPHVAIFVDQFASQGASVLGEVARPGVYPVLGKLRLFDLISAAGGLNDKAGRTVTITHRNQPDKPVVVELARNIADGAERNVEVFPGDTVIVRKADVVYVVGDVNRPSGFLMDRGSLTVLQAVALAGGTTQTAKLNNAKIIRKDAGGEMSETPVELKKILQAKAADIPMRADDILFIPTSTTKIMGRRGIDAAIQMATAVGIVAIR